VKRTVLVTDGEQRAALAVVRSLGRAGHAVHVVSTRDASLAGASRWCRSDARVPDPLVEPADFADAVRHRLDAVDADTLIPIAEPALLALLAERERLPGVLLPFPDLETFRRISDKALVLERAAPLGIAAPRQVSLTGPDDPAALSLSFPVALKPARSVAELDGRRVKVGVRYAASAVELQRVLESYDPAAFPVLAQQRITGPGVGVFLLRWNAEILAAFAHRRLREKPPSGGVSVYRESAPLDPALLERSRRLLESFDWSGVAMIEYKLDQATGTPYLMEINGRVWGSLQLAIDAGVNFPELLIRAATGHRAPAVLCWRLGVRSRWWWGDVDQLAARLRHSPERLNLPPGEPGRLAALARFLLLWRPGDRNEIFRLDDPRPFLRETADWLRRR
jgi:predicted ATP-grasp superfamily ATP-dependent carboligase